MSIMEQAWICAYSSINLWRIHYHTKVFGDKGPLFRSTGPNACEFSCSTNKTNWNNLKLLVDSCHTNAGFYRPLPIFNPSRLLKFTGAPNGCTGGGPRRPPTSPNKASFQGGRPADPTAQVITSNVDHASSSASLSMVGSTISSMSIYVYTLSDEIQQTGWYDWFTTALIHPFGGLSYGGHQQGWESWQGDHPKQTSWKVFGIGLPGPKIK